MQISTLPSFRSYDAFLYNTLIFSAQDSQYTKNSSHLPPGSLPVLMPRLPHSLLTKAYAKSPLLPIVLRGTRDLELAINELRWLSEHVSSSSNAATLSSPERKRLLRLCRRREKGEPLQYILGSQPFGPLDLKCRKGVLIPRYES